MQEWRYRQSTGQFAIAYGTVRQQLGRSCSRTYRTISYWEEESGRSTLLHSAKVSIAFNCFPVDRNRLLNRYSSRGLLIASRSMQLLAILTAFNPPTKEIARDLWSSFVNPRIFLYFTVFLSRFHSYVPNSLSCWFILNSFPSCMSSLNEHGKPFFILLHR